MYNKNVKCRLDIAAQAFARRLLLLSIGRKTMEPIRCPYCNSVARNDKFDTDTSTILGYYWCPFCGAFEINLSKSSYGCSGIEAKTGWYLPEADSAFWDVAKDACVKKLEEEGIPF